MPLPFHTRTNLGPSPVRKARAAKGDHRHIGDATDTSIFGGFADDRIYCYSWIMKSLSRLEHAVLRAIASQYSGHDVAMDAQHSSAWVTNRRNTGAGFYTTFAVDPSARLLPLGSPVGDAFATVPNLAYGIGFILWLKDGYLNELEGFSFGEDTSELDLETTAFELVDT
jgi:hypothetical protein